MTETSISTEEEVKRTAESPRIGVAQNDSWHARLAPFLERYFLVLCLGLVGIACVRVISTYNALSLTADESIHLACGMQYVAQHIYRCETQHPPLSRMMVALGPYIAGVRPGPNAHGAEGLDEIAQSGHVDRTVFLMRFGTLPFFLLACGVVCTWSRHHFGKPIAVVALALYTLLPVPLADSGLAITDMALGATVGAAFLAAVYWAEELTFSRSLLLGLAVGLACLSKFTALGYVPATVCLSFLFYLLVNRPGLNMLRRNAVRSLPLLVTAGLTTACVIWAGYWLSFGPLVAHSLHLRVPAPEFFDGIRSALNHNRNGHLAFLFGRVSMIGWWYYFPAVLFFKTPIAFLIFLAVGIFVCIRERRQIAYLLPVAFALGILLPAMRGRIDIGVRHIEPIYIGLSVIAALGIKELLLRSRMAIVFSSIVVALTAWMAISVAVRHPDYLSYVNEFAGKNPQYVLSDSNYDWGQDEKLLAAHLHQMGVQKISFGVLDGIGRADYLETWYGLPPLNDVDTCVPDAGWNVVADSYDEFYRFDLYGLDMPKPWYDQVKPNQRFGRFALYYVSPGAARSSQRCNASLASHSLAPH